MALVFTLVLPTTVLANTTASGAAEEHILNELRRAQIPNATIAVIQDGEISYILKDSEHDTLFAIASVTKPFTAFGVLLLEDMGLLSIHDPVNQHLLWFEVRYNGAPVPHEDITIHHLITHTSGIAQNEGRFPRATPTETTDEFTARLVGMELDFYPSTSSAYSNMAYIILGLLIEAVSGQSYDDFMTQQVFHPLGLYNTFTNSERARDAGRRVVNGHMRGFLHAWQDDRGSDRHRNPINTPSGGMYSNVSDLVRWAEIQLGIVDVPEQFARVVQRSHIPNLNADVGFTSGYFSDGGWVVDLENGHIEHSGGGSGFSANIRFFPESDIAVVVLANLRYVLIHNISAMAINAVVDGNFTNAGRDMHNWTDLIFTIVTALGLVYLFLFVRLFIKMRKQLRSGAVIKPSFSRGSLKGLFGMIFAIVGLVFYYVFPFVIMDTTRASLLINWPISFGVAAIAVWINVLYDAFAWWVKIAVKPNEI